MNPSTSQQLCNTVTYPQTHLAPLRQPQVEHVVDTAAHEDAEVGAVVQTCDAAAVANECAQEIATVEREAADVYLVGHDVDLWGMREIGWEGMGYDTSCFSELIAEHSNGSLLLVCKTRSGRKDIGYPQDDG